MNELDASLRRWEARNRAAIDLAIDNYVTGSDDDIDIVDDPHIESVDGGYWIAARVWVSAEDVEEALA